MAMPARNLAAQEEAVRIVLKGECPQCGAPLTRNLSAPGWFQCVAVAAPLKRAPAHRFLPACSFQITTA